MSNNNFNVFASETNIDSVTILSQVNQDDFVKVEVKVLPPVVAQSIEMTPATLPYIYLK